MAGTTTKGLRFPQNADAPNIAADFQNLATDVDTELDDYVLKAGALFTANPTVPTGIIFEGATPDIHETTLQVVDPTGDRTILLPDSDGTIALVSSVTTEAEIFNRARVTGFMLGGM
jgi:hypothetical protein